MSGVLADGNLLIALTVVDHVHHDPAVEWFGDLREALATCPITEGALIRFLLREGRGVGEAVAVLEGMRDADWHRFWPDAVPYDATVLAGVVGHRQVTDAYLAALARHHGGRVASFDRGLAALHGDVVDLVPTGA